MIARRDCKLIFGSKAVLGNGLKSLNKFVSMNFDENELTLWKNFIIPCYLERFFSFSFIT